MSGSPPPDTPRDPSQLAGRRRKRSGSPPGTTSSTVSSLPALLDHPAHAPRYGEQSPAQRRIAEPTMQLAHQNIPYLPPLTYGAVPAAPTVPYSAAEIVTNPQQASPRSTRKTKAHVASACINCKKKHLRCDNSRPCRRCVQGGKEDTCRDVEHKKRGRPPLKPEDPTAVARTSRGTGPPPLGPFAGPSSNIHGSEPQSYALSNYPPILPSAPPPMYGHNRSGSRSSLYGGIQSPYAAPSIAPSPMNATATAFSYSTRPQSTSSTISTQPPSPYVTHPAYMGENLPRQGLSYTGYSYHQMQMPSSSHGLHPSPIFPREFIQHPAQHSIQHQMPQQQQQQQQPPPPPPPESQYSAGLQLPPIRPAQQGPVDPVVSQQPMPREQDRRRDSGERDPKRPKMDIQGILGPRHD